jgi:diguanylate cyclase (GGDEF)-like protein
MGDALVPGRSIEELNAKGEASVSDSKDQNKATVLFVGASAGAIGDIAVLVRRDDRRVLCADSADDALSILIHNIVDLVIMSTMPGGDDGYALCRQIRAQPGVADVPVLLVADEGGKGAIVAGLEAGADDVLVQPLDERILSARVQAILRHGRFRRMADQARRLDEAQQQLVQMRECDAATGLPNADMFAATLRNELARAERSDYPLAVLVVELAAYDELHGIYGQRNMDTLIRAIADRLSHAVRGRAVIGRLDTRCFGICQPLPRAEELTRAVHNYRRVLAESFELNGQALELTTSMGASIFPADAPDAERLTGLALSAMSHARQMGRNRYHVLGGVARTEAKRRLSLESKIRKAIELENMQLHYQPRLRLDDGRVTGVEALLRILDEDQTLISPHVFMPIAEDSGLMERLGTWALNRACADAVSLIDAGFDLRMSVNLTGNLFSKDTFLGDLRSILARNHLDGTGLELEVSEQAIRPKLHGSLMRLQRLLTDLKEEGVTLTVDNFGTGYSCLETLRHLPMDIMKIGQSFVTSVPEDASLTAIVRSLIDVGRHLGLRVVCQGVENDAQLASLRDAGCHAAQGYLFARPVPLGDLHETLRALEGRFAPRARVEVVAAP